MALSYDPENTVARSLYASMGFVETGEISDNETVARRRLTWPRSAAGRSLPGDVLRQAHPVRGDER